VITININVSKKTSMAYLIFAFQGISSPLISVMLLEIAKKFGVDASAIGFSFTLWIIGGGLAGLFSGKLLEMKGTRFAMLLSLVFILLSVAGTLSPILITFSIGMFISGMGTFLLVAIANCLIVQQFDGETRTSQFNLLNFFYSSGALITPAIAGVLLNQGIRWELVLCYKYNIFVTKCQTLKSPLNFIMRYRVHLQ
jgi:MFS family permease